MNQEKPIVYVVDDDASVLKSLERLLRSDGYEVKIFPSAPYFLHFQHPDAVCCVILDVMMPELDGLQLQERLTDRKIAFPLIFITAHGTVPMSVRAMKAGAFDFLQKPLLDRDVLDVVCAALARHRQVKQEQKELRTLREGLRTLTPREIEVFKLVVTGMLNKQVAFELGTSEKTIKVHRARVMEKMGAKSLPDLCPFCRETAHSFPGALTCRIGLKSNISPTSIALKFISVEHVVLRPAAFSARFLLGTCPISPMSAVHTFPEK